MKVSGTVEKKWRAVHLKFHNLWNSTTNKHMKEWRLQPHRWCLLGHYPAWMCLDVTNFAIILPLNSVPEKKKTHLFASENSQKCEKKPSTKYRNARKNRAPFFVEILQNYPMFASSLIPAKKGSHLIITVLPACGCQSANEWCISPAGPPRHFSIPRIHSRPFTGENPTSSFRASRLLTYPGYSKFAPENDPGDPKNKPDHLNQPSLFQSFCC